jgi:hypothetical protein
VVCLGGQCLFLLVYSPNSCVLEQMGPLYRHNPSINGQVRAIITVSITITVAFITLWQTSGCYKFRVRMTCSETILQHEPGPGGLQRLRFHSYVLQLFGLCCSSYRLRCSFLLCVVKTKDCILTSQTHECIELVRFVVAVHLYTWHYMTNIFSYSAGFWVLKRCPCPRGI